MQVKVLTVLNNFGEEKYIVKYTVETMWLFFIKVTTWQSVTYKTDETYFYDDIEDARIKARSILANSNYKGERIAEILNVEEVHEI